MKNSLTAFRGQSRILAMFSLVIIGFVLLASCSKEVSGPTGGLGVNGSVKISVQGVLENSANSKRNFHLTNEGSSGGSEVLKKKDFTALINCYQGSVIGSENISGLALKSTLIPMEKGVKYRLLLYNKETTAFIKSFLFEAGLDQEIELELGIQYNFIAYSYNSATQALPNPSNFSSPKMSSDPKNDLLVYWGEFILSDKDKVEVVPIVFKHQLNKVKISVDTEKLYGDVSVFDATIKNETWIKTGIFNLKARTIENEVELDVSNYVFEPTDDGNQRECVFYISNPGEEFKINVTINKLEIISSGGNPYVIVDSPVSFDFDKFPDPSPGDAFIAHLSLYKTLKKALVVHVTTQSGRGIAGYDKSAGQMLDAVMNFGEDVNSTVHVQPFGHILLNNEASVIPYHGYIPGILESDHPDILIIGADYTMNDQDLNALLDWVNKGGVLIMGSDATPDNDAKIQLELVRKILDHDVNITMSDIGNKDGGDVIPFFSNDNNKPILNGPFGNLVGKYWGSDMNFTKALYNIPLEKIDVFSRANPINSSTSGMEDGITMFKHKTKNFIWIGDGGWTANDLIGQGNSVITDPLSIDPVTFKPVITERYGFPNNAVPAGATPVANSILFANVMAWAVIQAHFDGINPAPQQSK